MLSTKKKHIELYANYLLSIFESDNSDIQPPIDLNRILENYDIKLIYAKFRNKNIAGAFDKNKNSIYVNTDDSYTKKSFTIAHELGHIMLHMDKPREFFYRMDIDGMAKEHKEEDKEANLFAATLLMPEFLIKKYWKITKNINELAIIFGVSVPAVYFRIKTLHLKE